MGVRSTCIVVWQRGISGGIQKCHMQTYLYVMVINTRWHGHLFQNMGGSSCVDQLVTYRLVDPVVASAEAPKGSTLSHNKWCGNSVIYGVLESSLGVAIDYNLLCIKVFSINQAWILFEDNTYTPWSYKELKIQGIYYQMKVYSGCQECVACCVLADALL